jgi:hypothetical protein
MGKMEQTLNSEITRLAKKEMRATYHPLARDVRRLKRTVSAMRKTMAVLSRLGAELQAERTVEWAKVAAVREKAVTQTIFASGPRRKGARKIAATRAA